MVKITNKHMIDLPLAVWLLQDGYNSGAAQAPEGELISVTSLMKPTRQQILQRRVDAKGLESDVSDMIASRMGHALHDSIERSWTEGNWRKAMKMLHYTDEVVDSIVINPGPDVDLSEKIPIYLEQRGFLPFEDIVLTGQLDFLIGQAYRDFKSTSTFAWTSGNKDQDYILQGSMYRMIMPHLIKDDTMRIEFIFTDWQKFMAKNNPKYPQTKVAHREFQLMSIKETEEWVSDKLADIRKNAKRKQEGMVRCSRSELWQSDDAYKYFSNPETASKGGRCQKNFDSATDAQLHLEAKGKGVVVKVPGEVKACEYCRAFSVCEQRTEYFKDDGSRV